MNNRWFFVAGFVSVLGCSKSPPSPAGSVTPDAALGADDALVARSEASVTADASPGTDAATTGDVALEVVDGLAVKGDVGVDGSFPGTVVTGFSVPESALHDPVADVYLVSNISGSPFGNDHDGFISKVAPDGRILSLRFIDGKATVDGLSAPKGMALVGRTLYVADLDRVRTFDADTGAPKDVVVVEGAVFLNDVVSGADGTVYVTDTGLTSFDPQTPPSNADAVVVLDKNGARRIASGSALGQPNGIVLRGDRLEMVTLGTAEWITFDLAGAVLARTKLPGGMLDGLVVLPDGRMLASAWETKSIYALDATRTATAVFTDLESPADIGYDATRNVVLVPQMMLDRLAILRL